MLSLRIAVLVPTVSSVFLKDSGVSCAVHLSVIALQLTHCTMLLQSMLPIIQKSRNIPYSLKMKFINNTPHAHTFLSLVIHSQSQLNITSSLSKHEKIKSDMIIDMNYKCSSNTLPGDTQGKPSVETCVWNLNGSGNNKHRLFPSRAFCDSNIKCWFQW